MTYRSAMVGLFGLLSAVAAGPIEAASLEIRTSLVPPAPPTMEGYSNPSMVWDVQLQAIRHNDDSSTQDVTLLAAWASSQPAVGTVSVSGLFHGTAPGQTLVTATHGGLTSPAALVRIGGFAAAAPRSAQRSASVIHPFQATTDPGLEAAMLAILQLLFGAGLVHGPLVAAVNGSDYHEEGVNAGGAPVSSDGEATTYQPGGGLLGIGISFVGGHIVIVYDGRYHSVFKPGDAAELRGLQFFTATGLSTSGLRRALHEMLHVILHTLGIDIGSEDEEQFVSLAERLLTAILEVFRVPGRGDEAIWREYIKTLFKDLLAKTGGKALLDALGIKDEDGDGLPDLLRNAPKVCNPDGSGGGCKRSVPGLPWPAATLLALVLATLGSLVLRNRARPRAVDGVIHE